ncbi:hypothetical protein [Streptomyces sp. NPDC001292]|uniref:hypothetical protein n=1 Tax=Streptomyces sp. NPDC001292 TaxID=3364558 RepID=UPI00369759C4
MPSRPAGQGSWPFRHGPRFGGGDPAGAADGAGDQQPGAGQSGAQRSGTGGHNSGRAYGSGRTRTL